MVIDKSKKAKALLLNRYCGNCGAFNKPHSKIEPHGLCCFRWKERAYYDNCYRWLPIDKEMEAALRNSYSYKLQALGAAVEDLKMGVIGEIKTVYRKINSTFCKL